MGDDIALNFYTATFSGPARVLTRPWTTSEAARTLEESLPGLRTWRDPDDGKTLVAWHPQVRAEDLELTGFRPRTRRIEEAPKLFQRLLLDVAEQRLVDLGFERKRRAFVNYGKPSLIASVPPLRPTATEPIGIYPGIILDCFFTKDVSGHLRIGLVVDVLYTTRLDVTAEEWVAAGLGDRLQRKYVVLVNGSQEGERFPDYVGRSIGRVDGVRGDECLLVDLRDGNTDLARMPLAAIAPEPNRRNLAEYLDARYEGAYARGEDQVRRALHDLVRPQKRCRHADEVIRRIRSDDLFLLPGLSAQLGGMLRAGAATLPVQRLEEPVYSFDPAGDKVATRVDAGLRDYGPYDRERMRGRGIRMLLVAPQAVASEVRTAASRLVDGIPDYTRFFQGMRNMYRLDRLECVVEDAEIHSDSASRGYTEAVNRAFQCHGSDAFDLIVPVIRQGHRDLPDRDNPYFQTKALALVAAGIPTQALTIEKLRQGPGDLQFILNTMALACYAKMGGTSHVLQPAGTQDDVTELVLGIGRAMRRKDRFGQAEETIGFATVFRANGEYLFNDCTPYCASHDYVDALTRTTIRAVEKVAAFERIPEGGPLRLFFHLPRRPGAREEAAILAAVETLSQFDIDFALIHVNDGHHLQLFDLANTGARSHRGQPKPAANLLPQRGLSLQLGPRERLLTFVGVDQYRGYGTPTPLRITVDRRSTFGDPDYAAQQVFLLSFMDVGTLNPSIRPVSISYPEKLANLTSHLRGFQQWSVDLIQQKLGRSLWFV